MKFYAENFKRLRKSAGMTQDEIAKKLNVTKQVVCMWERSGKKPDYAKIPELIGLLKCKCSDICDLAVKEESDYDSFIYAVLQEELKHLDIDGKRSLLRTIVVYTTYNIKFRKERQRQNRQKSRNIRKHQTKGKIHERIDQDSGCRERRQGRNNKSQDCRSVRKTAQGRHQGNS